MKITKIRRLTPVKASRNSGLVAIWWYTDNGEFWDYSTTLDDAVECHGYLQASNEYNHMSLWRKVVRKYISDPQEQAAIIAKGFKSIERGRVVFNIRTQCYEIICSEVLVNDRDFRDACKSYFNLNGCRCEFEALHHYFKQELTGNPAVDDMYYD